MAEMHKCGQGWAYCDGNCATCATNIPTYTTTSTDDDFRWLGKNTDGKPMGGSGAKTEMSGFVTRIEPGKKEPYTVIFTTADHEKYLHMQNECRKMIGHAKPTVDAVAVCRCGDCKHGSEGIYGMMYCKFDTRERRADWFCADGERKGGPSDDGI